MIFDRSIVKTSVTEDLEMTCDDLYLQSIFNSLFLGGMLLGSFSIGIVSDKIGRVKALVLSIFLVGGSGLAGKNEIITQVWHFNLTNLDNFSLSKI